MLKQKIMYKKLTLFSLFLIVTGIVFAQSFSVDDNVVTLNGSSTDVSIANNTFLNALSSETLQWLIVDASIPEGWEFSNCFPNCYDIGVTSGSLEMLEGESYYLNCHIYPNEIPGEGSVTMQILDNTGTVEEVTWQAVVGSASLIEIYLVANEKEIKSIYTMDGKMVSELLVNQLQFVVFSDGTSKQLYITE